MRCPKSRIRRGRPNRVAIKSGLALEKAIARVQWQPCTQDHVDDAISSEQISQKVGKKGIDPVFKRPAFGQGGQASSYRPTSRYLMNDGTPDLGVTVPQIASFGSSWTQKRDETREKRNVNQITSAVS